MRLSKCRARVFMVIHSFVRKRLCHRHIKRAQPSASPAVPGPHPIRSCNPSAEHAARRRAMARLRGAGQRRAAKPRAPVIDECITDDEFYED